MINPAFIVLILISAINAGFGAIIVRFGAINQFLVQFIPIMVQLINIWCNPPHFGAIPLGQRDRFDVLIASMNMFA